ncbi:MAG: pyridoxine/pyridoxal/pyridoxamine kinase [Oscillospiraceae bacterium]|nr:pyridoxine/pyridoxal/pyridoxamine kinase [Oscillospiraceae bacterium]
MKKALTIAGSDTSGGAGIQADLKTFQELGVFGMNALTVIVAMNPHDGWAHQVFPIPTDTIKPQIETVLGGIGVDAVKTGMLPTTEIIELVAVELKKHQPANIVIDPVMKCKDGGEPLRPENAECYRRNMLSLATIVTPNLFEACQLSGMTAIENLDDMKHAAQIISDLGAKNVVIKGGKSGVKKGSAVDLFYDGSTFEVLECEKIDTAFTHGAGCTFAAAVTASLAKGESIRESVGTAKAFVTEAIRHSFRLNQYVGPTNHSAYKRVNSTD